LTVSLVGVLSKCPKIGLSNLMVSAAECAVPAARNNEANKATGVNFITMYSVSLVTRDIKHYLCQLCKILI